MPVIKKPDKIKIMENTMTLSNDIKNNNKLINPRKDMKTCSSFRQSNNLGMVQSTISFGKNTNNNLSKSKNTRIFNIKNEENKIEEINSIYKYNILTSSNLILL
jgi:hypothetical protein